MSNPNIVATQSAIREDVEISNWSFSHSGETIINNLSLSIRQGERVLIIGPSGCGKSTLLLALAGLVHGFRGSILIGGEQPAPDQTAFVMQDPDSQVIFPNIGDEVAFPLELTMPNRRDIWEAVSIGLKSVGLSLPTTTQSDKLSHGQKQCLSIACAFASCPKILLLDEPLASLDKNSTEQVLKCFDSLFDVMGSSFAYTTFITGHDVEPWINRVDRVVVFNSKGSLSYDLPVGAIKNNKAILQKAGVFYKHRTLGNRSGPRTLHDSNRPVIMEVTNLAVTRGKNNLFENVTFQVHSGECIAIIGPNGVGKTSILLTVSGLMRAKRGDIFFECCMHDSRGRCQYSCGMNRDILTHTSPCGSFRNMHPPARCIKKPRHMARNLRKHTAIVMQNPEHQFLASSVDRELALGKGNCFGNDDLLERLNLLDAKSLNPFTLSWGQKRRLALAISVSMRPRILLLDEPLVGQDADISDQIVDFLIDLKLKGLGILIATHSKPLIDALADRVMELKAGEIAWK